MSVFSDFISFETLSCSECSMPFAITTVFRKRRIEDHKSFYCPQGHQQYFPGKNEKEKLEEKLKEKQRELEAKDRKLEAERGRSIFLENELGQVKKSNKKMRERIFNGVCPCCNRSFDNLMQHMKTKHPSFKNPKSLKIIRQVFGLTQAALAEEIGVIAPYVSRCERGKPVPEQAKTLIYNWLSSV